MEICNKHVEQKMAIKLCICNIRVVLLWLLLFSDFVCYAQVSKPEKRIYVVDVTASMEGKGINNSKDIFGKVKAELSKAIEEIPNEETKVSIIAFTDRPHVVISGNSSDKQELLEAVSNLEVKRGDTNIADAWIAGVNEIDTTAVNYLFLLTDGLHNSGPDKEVLYQRLRDWGENSKGRYNFAFYVMLTPDAKEQDIRDVVDDTRQMWLIESMNVNVTFVNTSINIKANIKNNKKLKLRFSSNNPAIFKEKMPITLLLSENPYYIIVNSDTKLDEDGTISFELAELIPHLQIPVKTDTELNIKYDVDKYPMVFFTPELLHFIVENRGIRKMTIKEISE